jgi:hypothetical protein
MAVELFMRVDGRGGMWRFLFPMNGRYVVLSLDGRPDVVMPYLCHIVAHKMLKT